MDRGTSDRVPLSLPPGSNLESRGGSSSFRECLRDICDVPAQGPHRARADVQDYSVLPHLLQLQL